MKIKFLTGRVDMTAGNPLRQILISAAPLLIVNAVSFVTSSLITDIYSSCIGASAFSVTSATSAVTALYADILSGIISAAQILVSQQIGAQRRDEAISYSFSALYLLFIAHIAAAAAMIAAAEPILKLLNIPAEIYADSLLYFRLYVALYIVTAVSSLLISLVVSYDDVGYILVIHLASLLFNLINSAIFIAWLGLGVAGMVICSAATGFSVIALTVFLMRRLIGRGMPLRNALKFNWEAVKRIFSRGMLIALQTIFVSAGNLYASAVINASLPVDFIATLSMSFPMTAAFTSLVTAMSVFCAQNYGKGDYSRIKRGLRDAFFLIEGYAAVCAVVYFFGARGYFGLLGFKGQILEFAAVRYRWYALSMLPLGVIYTFRFALDSMGCSRYTVFAGICELAGYVLSGAYLIPRFGEPAAASLFTVSWTLSAAYLTVIYFVKRRKIYSETGQKSV